MFGGDKKEEDKETSAKDEIKVQTTINDDNKKDVSNPFSNLGSSKISGNIFGAKNEKVLFGSDKKPDSPDEDGSKLFTLDKKGEEK